MRPSNAGIRESVLRALADMGVGTGRGYERPELFLRGAESVMSASAPEPTMLAKGPVPVEETSEAWTGETVLAHARALASELDPPRAQTYRAMSPSRWLHAVDLGAELLTAHAAYRLHSARGRGRRLHAAEIYAVLDETNCANLIAAVAVMLVMGRFLDRSPCGA